MKRTVRLSLVITLVTAAIGVPLAYVMHRAGSRVRMLLIVVIVLPLMTSVVVRTFGWVVILGRNGLLARLVEPLGVAPGFALMHTETGIVRVAHVTPPSNEAPVTTPREAPFE